MSMDFNIKPVGAPVATPVAPPVSEAVNHAVATELPAPRSVTVVDASVRARSRFRLCEPFAVASGGNRSSRGVDRLPGGRREDEQVVKQFPEEAILRRRAYFHSLDQSKGVPTRMLATDRKI